MSENRVSNKTDLISVSVPNQYRQCRYLLSVHHLHQLPADDALEVAFAGRSNAGKSSAINRICNRKSLAKTSRTPGRTQAINFFSLDNHRFIVDLPGYGYAKVASNIKRHWEQVLTEYIATRRSLQGIILIMDVRHPLQDTDWNLLQLAVEKSLPVHFLLTKCDKLSLNQRNKQLWQTKAALERMGIEATLQLFSALAGTGVEDAHYMLNTWFQFNSDER